MLNECLDSRPLSSHSAPSSSSSSSSSSTTSWTISEARSEGESKRAAVKAKRRRTAQMLTIYTPVSSSSSSSSSSSTKQSSVQNVDRWGNMDAALWRHVLSFFMPMTTELAKCERISTRFAFGDIIWSPASFQVLFQHMQFHFRESLQEQVVQHLKDTGLSLQDTNPAENNKKKKDSHDGKDAKEEHGALLVNSYYKRPPATIKFIRDYEERGHRAVT